MPDKSCPTLDYRLHIENCMSEWNYKPGSVLNDHLSRIHVTMNFKQPT